MKKSIPNWVWIIIGILALAIIILFSRNVILYNNYYNCVLDKVDDISDYIEFSQDYLELLICYQEGLPTCEPQIQKYGNASVFTQNPS